MKPIVYFSREITPEKVLELYRALGRELPGKIAVKVHSGEEGNQNFLHPEFWKSVVDAVNGTVVECNTAYEGARNYTEQHRRLLRTAGRRCSTWTFLMPKAPIWSFPFRTAAC